MPTPFLTGFVGGLVGAIVFWEAEEVAADGLALPPLALSINIAEVAVLTGLSTDITALVKAFTSDCEASKISKPLVLKPGGYIASGSGGAELSGANAHSCIGSSSETAENADAELKKLPPLLIIENA